LSLDGREVRPAHALIGQDDQPAVQVERMETTAGRLRVVRREIANAVRVERLETVKVQPASGAVISAGDGLFTHGVASGSSGWLAAAFALCGGRGVCQVALEFRDRIDDDSAELGGCDMWSHVPVERLEADSQRSSSLRAA
jgi:hypothetical protein